MIETHFLNEFVSTDPVVLIALIFKLFFSVIKFDTID